MSRLTDLLRQARTLDAQLAADLEGEVGALMKRRTFGLVFERHQPEAVELPGRPVRRGDKVRVLPPRDVTTPGDPRLWRVDRIERTQGGRVAHLSPQGPSTEDGAETALVEDLVVVAEFRDRVHPGLVVTGRIERGDVDAPFHTVINGENFHALQLLTYTHRGKVSCCFIDPPYNSGARDWKYNNDYVESDDRYRHSKWLAFMERRLQLVRELLDPAGAVLIVTIDEKEYARLALLLEQVFPEARIQMVSSVINPNGSARLGELTRVNEYIFFCFFGEAQPCQVGQTFRGNPQPERADQVRWERLMKGSNGALRADRPNLFYPVLVDPETWKIHGSGPALAPDADRSDYVPPAGLTAVWPLSRQGTEKRWQVSSETFRRLNEEGLARVGSLDRKTGQFSISYLNRGQLERWQRGEFREVGRDSNGVVELVVDSQPRRYAPTAWDLQSHNAGEYGSRLLRALLPDRRFPFPKSLYAVEDALRIAVGDKPDAVVLDFFAGSGTTAHAVMRLNRQDGGTRHSILITNNEVAAAEQADLRKSGLRAGDSDWEQWGICDHITKPRLEAAITGTSSAGAPIVGSYRFVDEFPMAEGIQANAAFFTLTYEQPLSVRHHRAFPRVAPMLWLRAGSVGPIISDLGEHGWATTRRYGVIADLDRTAGFLQAVNDEEQLVMVFIVTDDDSAFQMVCRNLPEDVEPVRLYESYLSNFEINAGAV